MQQHSPKKIKRVHVYPSRRYAQAAAVVRDYGIGRSTLFSLLHDKLVRSTVVRRGTSKKKLRLIDLQSLEEFLAKNATEPVA
jgi:hypothetical protein